MASPEHHQHSGHGGPTSSDTGASAIDPVCGMTVTIATAKHMHEHAGTHGKVGWSI